MTGYRDLPRGTDRCEGESPLATSRFATPDEITALAYKDGDILLGTLPVASPDAVREIEQLRAKQEDIAADTARDAHQRSLEIDVLQERIDDLAETDQMDIGFRDDRHHLIVAGNRAGKTSTILIPNLLRYPGSVIVTDPKGELAAKTAAHRGKPVSEGGLGQTTFVMDPYGTSRLPQEQMATWNAIDLIRGEDDLGIDVAASIADALIVRTNAENEHFDDSARILIKGLILFVAATHKGRATRNLVSVYEYLMCGAPLEMARDRSGPPQKDDPTPFEYLLGLMKRTDAFDGVIVGAAEALLSMGDRERGSVLSTARRSMEFLERRPMRRLFASSSFDLDALKTDPKGVTLYLCLPPQRMHDCGRFLRLMISMMLERIYAIEGQPASGHPVLAMLEEFPVLGHMTLIEQAAGYAAGFGLKMMIVIQDLTQLKRHYRDGWETFIGNAGCIQAFGNNDQTTLDYFSKKLGECEVVQTTHNISTASGHSTNDPSAQAQMQSAMSGRGEAAILTGPLGLLADNVSTGSSTSTTESWNTQKHRTPMLLPDELQQFLRREDEVQLVLINGEYPMFMRRST
ncbi:type IV secretory system conjugative DNA transfer family protein [uncultured Roseobacter sp.]|uniref:type IV secretory system conjugative DNA transfer family protein n=1 Tax=uncultured Roseobacter sp. TaxID=114847 RepID=UPI00260D0FE3|nr:type IV secretory system conjugative DNA transfer family protein [uncultured Roseobacter sp.]